MSKYTLATSLTFKRDIEEAQAVLTTLFNEIELRKKELKTLNIVLDEKRDLMSRFEEMVASVFSRGEKQMKDKEHDIDLLDRTISELQQTRDLLEQECLAQKENIREPEGGAMVNSVIQQLEPILDKMLGDISVAESKISLLQKQKVKWEVAVNKLVNEASEQETRLEYAQTRFDEIESQRSNALKELAREKAKMALIRNRERDVSVMQRRLSEEYKLVFKSQPSRTNKI